MIQSSSLQRGCRLVAAPIRVLIVDDSAVARAVLTRKITETPDFEVAEALDGARRAINWLASNSVDIVLLDIQMPGLDGIAALPELVSASGGARVLIVSTLAGAGAKATIQALALGAADTLTKPQVGGLGRLFGEVLIDKMRSLGKARPTAFVDAAEQLLLRRTTDNKIACLAIGASTGGLHALAGFFAALPKEFNAPILVTQHLPAVFMAFFAEQLSMMSGRTARVAEGDETLARGDLFVAPGNMHLGVSCERSKVKTVLFNHIAASRCCPSVDPMFSSAGDTFGPETVGIVLTGMGRDGEIGAQTIANAGGTVIVQDAMSSAVWGMPGTVARAGLASLVAPPAGLAAYVACRGVAG